MYLPKTIVAVNKKHNLILFYMGNNQGSTEKRLEQWDIVVQLSKSNLYQCRLNIQRRKMTLAQFRKWSQQHHGSFSSHTTVLSISHARQVVLHPLKIQPAHLNESFLVANISTVFDYLNILQYRLLPSRVTILEIILMNCNGLKLGVL